MLPVNEAIVVLAVISRPYNGAVWQCGPQTGRKRVGFNVCRRGSRATTASREWLTAFEKELLGMELVIRTWAIHVLWHEAMKFDREQGASLASWGVNGVGIKVWIVSKWKHLSGCESKEFRRELHSRNFGGIGCFRRVLIIRGGWIGGGRVEVRGGVEDKRKGTSWEHLLTKGQKEE